MRLVRNGLFVVFIATCFPMVSGCGSNEPTMEPRTEDEIQAYRDEVYAAEEEDDAAADE